ncbi:hypothetical protein IIA79_01375 [bacterium]|nr:hypothetical protein [bacterium]
MTDPKTKLRGQTDLGKAIDERIASRAGKLDMRHGTGDALPAPISGGGSIGGSPGGGDPAFPESYVESLKKNGEADALSGNIVLNEDGTAIRLRAPFCP